MVKKTTALEMSAAKVAKALRLFKTLRTRYPNAHCALNWSKPHELLIATILSAQSTDVGVNKATPALFAKFATPQDFANASPQAIEPFVMTLNFWRNKAKAVHESMRVVCANFHGEVPRTMSDLLTLRGVARKTANVVLGNAFNLNEGVVVDTHVGRLARRMGLSKHDDPVDVETDLMGLFPRANWCVLSHLLIAHGRSVCKARGETCSSDLICKEFCINAKLPASPSAHAINLKLKKTKALKTAAKTAR
ncbi:MAG: endonuclease III [Phycisphaerales bacterium]|nr:endonuclease III [Phycisphaerales bacterium]